MKPLILGLMLVLLAGCMSTPSPSNSLKVTVEELLKEPAKFSGKYITVSGYWVRGFEWSYLTADPQDQQGSPIWVTAWNMPGERTVDAQAIAKVIENAYRSSGKNPRVPETRIWIRCTGWFEHRELNQKSNAFAPNGFGHLGARPSQLTIERILEAHVAP